MGPHPPSMADLFFELSTCIPKYSKALQISCLKYHAFSPMPAVNTNASNPPNGATYEEMLLMSRYTYTSKARFTDGYFLSLGFAMMARSGLISEETPESPLSPDSCKTSFSI